MQDEKAVSIESYLSTHPMSKDRVENAKKEVETFKQKTSFEEWKKLRRANTKKSKELLRKLKGKPVSKRKGGFLGRLVSG
jgi:predicted Zn-dependent protease